MSRAKQRVESLLHKLRQNCSLEDIQHRLYVLVKVKRGLDDAQQRGTISQEDAAKRLSLWLIE
jgi:ribosomal protein S20